MTSILGDQSASILEHMLNGVALCRMLFADGTPYDFVYLYTNPAFHSQTGLGPVTGKRVSEVIPGLRDSNPQLFQIYDRVAAGGPPEQFETFIEALQRWFSIQVFCPKAEHFVTVFDVVTERKEIEDRLRMQTLVLDQIQEHVTITDLDGVVTYVNRSEAQALDRPRESLLGRHVSVYGEGAQADATQQEIVNATLTNGAWNGKVINFQANGTDLVLDLRTTLVKDESGKPVAMVGIGTDITLRLRAEVALQASEERYRTAFHTSIDAVNINRLNDGMFIEINPAFTDMTGHERAEVIGRTSLELNIWADIGDRQRLVELLQRDSKCANFEARFRKKNGELVWGLMSATLTSFEGVPCILSVTRDVTERKKTEERIHYLAHFDTLTGLPNRTQLDEHARVAISRAKRGHDSVALMYLDLDHFKDINATLGHSVGDALLVELARRLGLALREQDTVARPGGDEFILLFYGVDAHGASQVAQKLLAVIAEPCRITPYDLNVTASIGIALYPGDGTDLETLFRRADTAMYRAKQEGRHAYRFFTAEMQARSARHLQLVSALRHALERQQFEVHYQPQVCMRHGRIVGAEALLRWTHPELGSVSPAEFIPAAEDSGLILPIGEWVLRQAVQQARRWLQSGLDPLIIAVNLSAVQFRQTDLPALVSRIIDEEGLPPEYLELELTEGVAMHDPQSAIAVMNDLHERGVRMSIDDFGTGYSSLSHLKKFKIYKLKIDQSFVRDISTDPEDKAIVGAIINMARSLGLQTIAEGVETVGQLSFLREQGCDEMQGYYFSKPLPADRFEAFARARA